MKTVTIIGSGMAACQFIREIRQLDTAIGLHVISDKRCDNYAKPQLSMLCRMKKQVHHIISQHHEDFCEQYDLHYTCARVASINPQEQKIEFIGRDSSCSYETLVLAHGAQPYLPFPGTEHLFYLENAQQLYQNLQPSSKVAILGGGFIGTEITDDLSYKIPGDHITLYAARDRLVNPSLPIAISDKLCSLFQQKGVRVCLNTPISSVNKIDQHYFINDEHGPYDMVISALGMRVATLGLNCPTERGLLVNEQLCVTDRIYALGDCVQAQGRYLPYIQPLMEQARFLAALLTQKGPGVNKRLPKRVFTVNVKTPSLPIAFIGSLNPQESVCYQREKEGVYIGWQQDSVRQIILFGQEGLGEKMRLLACYEEQLAQHIGS